MKLELNDMCVQNQYLVRKADWTVRDTLVSNVEKMEVRVQEIHKKLDHAKEQIKENAKNTLGTVCLLSKLHSDQHIEVELQMDELDLTAAESQATYEEIKDYVLD